MGIINSFLPFKLGFDKTELISWYDMETDGSDSHIGGHDLTGVNTPGHTTSGGGKIDESADLVRASEEFYTHADGAPFDHTGAFTVGAWVNTDGLTGNQVIMSKWEGSTERSFLFFISGGNDYFQLNVSGDGAASVSAAWTTEVVPSTWYFVVAEYSPSTHVKIWVDDDLKATNTTSIPAAMYSGANTFDVGGLTGNTISFDGLIDSPFIFHRLLTAAEKTVLFNTGTGLRYSQL